jgi:hypothetical protein
MDFKDFYSVLPLASQVDPYHFYVPGYTESLRLFSEVRVVLNEEWLSGVPYDLKDYFFKVQFPCYFIPIFRGSECYGFVVKGFSKMTPRFCTNMLLPGCERINGGELVILVEGFKDAYLPMLACEGLRVVVVPMLTSVPSKELLSFLAAMQCLVLYVSDNDEHRAGHSARFFELAGHIGVRVNKFDLRSLEDFGDFFLPSKRDQAVIEARSLRSVVMQQLQVAGGMEE